MNRTETTTAIVWLDLFAARAKAEAAKLRGDLEAEVRAELEEHGTASTWRIPDLATVSATVSHAAVYVADEAAFTVWVQKRYPTEVEVITRVRSAWLAGFLHRAPGSVGVVADPDSGEVVPGLSIRGGGELTGISIRVTPAAKEAFAALADRGLKELAATAGPNLPVVLAEVASADA